MYKLNNLFQSKVRNLSVNDCFYFNQVNNNILSNLLCLTFYSIHFLINLDSFIFYPYSIVDS